MVEYAGVYLPAATAVALLAFVPELILVNIQMASRAIRGHIGKLVPLGRGFPRMTVAAILNTMSAFQGEGGHAMLKAAKVGSIPA